MTTATDTLGITLAHPPLVDVAELVHILSGSAEHAVLDVREEGEHSRDGHIILSALLPLSRMELRVATFAWRPKPSDVKSSFGS